MDKSPDAFRTISEVAELLETPAHVLRFWETRFPQIRPVKRAGGRRYYRPADLALLTGIKHLLHDEGMTIRGVQKMLREQGVRHVAGLSGQDVPDEADSAEAALEAALAANFAPETPPSATTQENETAQVVALESALRARKAVDAAAVDEAALASADTSHHDPVTTTEPEPVTAEEAPAAAPAADAPDDVPSHSEAPALPPHLTGPQDPVDALPLFAALAPASAEPTPALATATPKAAEKGLMPRLQRLPKGSLATAEAQALRDRLADLAARMAAPPPPNPF